MFDKKISLYCDNPNCFDNKIISDSVVYDSKNNRFYHNNSYCDSLGNWEVVLNSDGKAFIMGINIGVIDREKRGRK
ncbi:MAG: hypothetical protein NUV46_03895 [Nanoarchaeota archaeon]|nr:hypothetical protein [Nanoarchaeota archaeon]